MTEVVGGARVYGVRARGNDRSCERDRGYDRSGARGYDMSCGWSHSLW